MSRPLRILHLADTHIGAGLPARPRRDRSRRGDDLISSYRNALRQATVHEVDLVIHAGDLFDAPDPSGPAIAAAAEPLLDVAARGVPVVVVPGNHERSVLPGSLLFQHPLVHVLAEPRSVVLKLRGQRVVVAGIPCVRREAAARFDAALAATGWQQAGGDVHILVLHQTVESATCGPANYRFRSGPDVIERDAIPPGFDYVALGHVHRHQVLDSPLGCPVPIVYAGSPDRVSFAERDEPKGCVLVEQDGTRLRPRFLEHEVRPMLVRPLDISGCSRGQVRELVVACVAALPPRAYVALRLTGRTTRARVRGLRLARLIESQRPDVLARVEMRGVEYVPERAARPAGDGARARSAFADLPPVGAEVSRANVADLARLPNVCGTYAMYDRGGRLLYVGKSKQVRTRVRSHLRERDRAGFYAGWTREIATVELRPAGSELEALLAEAELIRRLRPPFNRQMRMWERYCYLSDVGAAYGQLAITRSLPEGGRCFGPYRSRSLAEAIAEAAAEAFGLPRCPADAGSRSLPLLGGGSGARLCERYYAGLCGGVCAQRVDAGDFAARLAAHDDLLAGRCDQVAVAAEAVVEALTAEEQETPRGRVARYRAQVLREAFERGALLAAAERLPGRVVWLPGLSGEPVAVVCAADGIRIVARAAAPGGGSPLDGGLSGGAQGGAGGAVPRLDTAVVDVYCTLVQYARREPRAAPADAASACPIPP